MKAAEYIYACRCEAAALFGLRDPERVILTGNATHALNIAIKGLVTPGGDVLASGLEHNAVMRPFEKLKSAGVTVRIADTPIFDPEAALTSFRREIERKRPDLVVCIHVSNVFGCELPVREIDALCAGYDVPLVIDASQSAGILHLDVGNFSSRVYVCMPGHKGLYGPQGTGLLVCADGELPTLLEGGTGSNSTILDMPDFLPDRLEAGTQNSHGAAGLREGIHFVREKGLAGIERSAHSLIKRTADGLRTLPGVTVHLPEGIGPPPGLLSFTVEGKLPEDVADLLATRGIAVRAGMLCAPAAHRTAGTTQGTVRLSVSAYTKPSDVDALVEGVGDSFRPCPPRQIIPHDILIKMCI